MKKLSNDQMWDVLVNDCEISDETLQALTCINGDNEQTYNDLLYWKTGYRDFEQAYEAEPDSFYNLEMYLEDDEE